MFFYLCISNDSEDMVFRAPDGRYGAMNNLEDTAQSANNNPLKTLNSISGNNHAR